MPNAPPVAHTRTTLVELWRRTMAPSYTAPMEAAAGGGMEAINAEADIMARASVAAVRLDTDYRLDTAPDGSYAEVDVTVTRSNAPALALTLDVGTQFETADGLSFVIPPGTTALAWAASENSAKTVTLRSLVQSYQVNVRAGTVSVLAVVLPDGQDAALGTITVTNAAPASGGVPDLLAAVASDRAAYRRPGEPAEAFRARAKQLGDILTPGAFDRMLDAACKPFGLAHRIVEGALSGPACDDDACDDETAFEDLLSPGYATVYAVIENATGALTGTDASFCDDDACCDDGSSCDGEHYESDAFYAGVYENMRAMRAAGVFVGVAVEGA